MGDDVIEGLLAGEDGRELNAVIGSAGFRADNRNLEPVVIALENFLDDTATGHAGPDNHYALFVNGHVDP